MGAEVARPRAEFHRKKQDGRRDRQAISNGHGVAFSGVAREELGRRPGLNWRNRKRRQVLEFFSAAQARCRYNLGRTNINNRDIMT